MKKLITTIMLLCLPCLLPAGAEAATVYAIEGYYESGASACSDVTSGDTAGDLEAALTAAGANGTLNICSGAYTNTEIDADNTLDFTGNGQTVRGVGDALLSVDSTAEFIILLNGNTDGVVDNLSLQFTDGATEGSGAAIRLRGTDSLVSAEIKNCTIYGFESADTTERPRGIACDGETVLNGDGIHDNEIYNLHKGIAIENNGADVTTGKIRKNYIHDGTLGTINVRDGIVTGGTIQDYDGLIVEYNTLENWPDESIDVLNAINVIVRNNFINGTGVAGGQGGGIKLSDGSAAVSVTGQECYNNTIVNLDKSGIEAGRTGGNIYNNTIANCGDWGIIVNCNDADNDLNIVNNAIYDCGDTIGDNDALVYYFAPKIATFDNNGFGGAQAYIAYVIGDQGYTDLATYQAAVTPDNANSIYADPNFASPTAGTWWGFMPMNKTLWHNGSTSPGLTADGTGVNYLDASDPPIGAVQGSVVRLGLRRDD